MEDGLGTNGRLRRRPPRRLALALAAIQTAVFVAGTSTALSQPIDPAVPRAWLGQPGPAGEGTGVSAPAAAPRNDPIGSVSPSIPSTAASGGFRAQASASDADEPRTARRERLASVVSRETRRAVPHATGAPPPVPQARSITGQHLRQRAATALHQAEEELRRGAVHSARDSALACLRMIAAARDLEQPPQRAVEGLERGVAALREAGDFVGRYGAVDRLRMERMVSSHRTTALKGCQLDGLTPHAAADVYLDYARWQLAVVADRDAVAAAALGVLGRAERQRDRDNAGLGAAIEVGCLRAAVQSNPDSALLASQLGSALLQLGLDEEARWAHAHSVALHPTPATARRLIELHRRAGDHAAAASLLAQLPAIEGQRGALPEIVQLSPAQFAQLSAPPPGQPPRGGDPSGPRPVAAPVSATGRDAAGLPLTEPSPAAPLPDAELSPLEKVARSVSRLWK